MFQWELMVIDDEIIVILLAFFMATVAWRYFFRWDSRYGVGARGINLDEGIELVPPFPRQDNGVIAIISSTRWNLAIRCTWLVRGLLAAGYRVRLFANTIPITKDIGQDKVHDIIFYNSFSSVNKVTQVIEHARVSGAGHIMLVNFGGNRGLKNIRSVMLGSGVSFMQQASCTYLISETKLLSIPELEQGLFKDVLLVQRSRGRLHDAELLTTATILRWLA